MNFNSTQTAFNFTNALLLAGLANTAYANENDIFLALQKWGFSQQRYLQCRDTACFVAATNDFIVVSFRGTQDIGDWMTNLDALPITSPVSMVHQGFYHALLRVWDDLTEAINKFQDNSDDPIVTPQ